MSIDWRILAALYLLALPLVGWFVARGFARLKGGFGGALLWWLAAADGGAFLALTTVSAFMHEPEKVSRYDIALQIVRGSSLGTGVIFLFCTLVALQPVVLELLEGRSFVTFVSARLMRASKSGFLTLVTQLSVGAVAVSAFALCMVTSIMGGFGHDLKQKILGNTAHVIIDAPGTKGFENWSSALEAVREAAKAQGGAATPIAGGDAMASSATNTAGTQVRGIEPESIGQVINLKKNIEIGKFEYLLDPAKLLSLPAGEIIGRGPGGAPYYKGAGFRLPPDVTTGSLDSALGKPMYPGIIVGRELAKSLHVMVGDELTMLSPIGELGPTGIMPRARKFRVAAIFYSGMYEYDASQAYVLLEQAQSFFDLESKISSIDIRFPEPELVSSKRPGVDGAIAAVNKGRLRIAPDSEPLRVRDWKEMNKNLFSALKLEKVAIFIILSIAITVASFSIICTVLLMVSEKTKEIAVLKSLGSSDRAIMGIFMLEGSLIGAFGTILGVVTALALCLGLEWTGVRLNPDVYYIDKLPINVDRDDYIMVALTSLVICALATIYPAFTASRTKPVDGLRYE